MYELHAAQQASADARAWYDRLCQDIHAGVYQHGGKYHSFRLTSIFDAKPIAFRAKPVYQYTVVGKPAQLKPTKIDESTPSIVGYYLAAEAEREAWSLYRARYTGVVLQWLRERDESLKEVDADVFTTVNHFRRWEVKPC